MKTIVLIPCLNEQDSISRVFYSLKDIKETSVCLIDDGSSDETFQKFSRIKRSKDFAIRFPINLGISAAISAGATLATDNGFEFILQCDGDGQHTGDSVKVLIEVARDLRTKDLYDFVLIGSRFTGANTFHGTSKTRILGSKVLSILLSALYRRKFTDPTSGLRLYSGRAVKLLRQDYPREWPEPIVLGRITKCQIPVHEVAVGMANRESGKSKISGFGSAIYMLKVVTLILTDRLLWKPREL
jgi:glycosyltransferase involved in cell wall biosynthesis